VSDINLVNDPSKMFICFFRAVDQDQYSDPDSMTFVDPDPYSKSGSRIFYKL
jgi:hypothetical protein